jgi:hypothetical protein
MEFDVSKGILVNWLRTTHLILCLFGRVGQKWWLAHQHFVENDAHTPPVAQLGVAAARQHFGRNVVGCADNGVGFGTILFTELSSIAGDKNKIQNLITFPILLNIGFYLSSGGGASTPLVLHASIES